MFDRPKELEWAEYLDELEPLNNVNCIPFSALLKRGDPTAYEIGFDEWLQWAHPTYYATVVMAEA